MNILITDISFLLLVVFLFPPLSRANDTLNTTQSIGYNQTLISSAGKFELGFFSPGNSNNWYAGIWYKNITVKTVVWVANRETPLKNSTSAELKLTQTGVLVILGEKNNLVWSSNNRGVARNPVLKLLDSGNLVLIEKNNYVWQSFDYPTDTFLPGMNLGLNLATGREYQLSSWKNDEDPAPGDFTLHMDPTGYPQVLVKRRNITVYRVGPWNGMAFSGAPDRRRAPNEFKLPMNKNGVYFSWQVNSSSFISRFILNSNGVGQRRVWVDQTHEWVPYLNIPADNCDNYKLCGAYGSCSTGYFPVCGCLDKFVPNDPEGWNRGDWSKGCVRRRPLDCEGGGDGFLKYSGIKLPDARNSWYNGSMTLKECKAKCLKNCSCTAYSYLDISRGGSGCLIWLDDLVDIRVLYAGGQEIHVRMASSELGNGKRREKLILILTTVGVCLLGLSLLLYIWRRLKNTRKRRKFRDDFLFSTNIHDMPNHTVTHNKDLELPLFNLSTISKATKNFSIENKLGEGGYGPVYKGTLGGQEIAVKRLSKTSNQGLDEFKNEVICIAKLQHRNLVKLLGCCIQGDEKMLVYEYMPNKSLDLVLFNERNRMDLDWPKRFHIINGIARGLVYLHQDSRLRIIHRDLKASNILLDSEMNPKISDFGIAKRFHGNQIEDRTGRVIGTYGYMSPEYAVHGRFSVKSDIFSFGVIVLEIISGKRNSSFCNGDHRTNLLEHAWELHKEGRSLEIVDTYLQNSVNTDEVLRVIHIGLLCVQRCPHDRPAMTSVVSMLNNEVLLPQVNCPGFYVGSDKFAAESNDAEAFVSKSTNEVTITMLQGR